MKPKPISIGVLGVILAVTACDRDHDFKTHAVYEAPINQLRLTVDGTGTVRAGLDVAEDGNARARITSLDPASPVTVSLEVTGGKDEATYQIDLGTTQTLDWTWNSAPDALARVLSEAGVEIRSADEIEECVHVINGVASGPKGTTLEGQSRALAVHQVSTEYR